MGLKDDLYRAFTKNMSDADGQRIELTDFQKKKAEDLSENLKEAFINFLVKQTFTIKEMKAILEVESIKTTTTLQANVEDSVSVTPGIAVATTGTATSQFGSTTAPGYINKLTGKQGVTIPKLDLGKDTGTQGGRLYALGHAYIGPASPEGEINSNFEDNKVQINREDIVDE